MTRFVLPVLALAALTTPAWADCKEEATRFQKLLDGDLKTGFVGKEVHTKASAEVKAASALCKAGQDAQATAAIRTTRVRYGYPAGSGQNLPQ